MADKVRNREWLEAEELESSAPGLPRPDLNPLVNPLLAQNMGRWAQVYFTSPADRREQAVEKLVEELKAQSSGDKPAVITTSSVSDRAPSIPESKTEIEVPELPMEPPAKRDDVPGLTANAEDLVVCPGCLRKNAAEQRFCGICGTALGQEVGSEKSCPAPELPAQPTRPAENSESDWQWLRERTLAGYETETNTRSRSWIVVLVLLAIAAGGYFLWRNRAVASHEQLPSTSSAPAPNSAPAVDLPIAIPPAASRSQQAPGTKTEGNVAISRPSQPARQDKKASAMEPSSELSSDDGRTELDRARQYLAGEGVPKNSWMASQLLWKAIAKENSEAVLLLSDLYARGDGVPRSCEQARVLLVSAAKKGSSAAAEKLRSIETGCR